MIPKAPNYTQIPNVIFESWLRCLKPSSGVLVLIFFWKLFQFDRTCDYVSKKELSQISGLGETELQSALDELEGHRVIVKYLGEDGSDFDTDSYMIAPKTIVESNSC